VRSTIVVLQGVREERGREFPLGEPRATQQHTPPAGVVNQKFT
jgi:hypothetical protein